MFSKARQFHGSRLTNKSPGKCHSRSLLRLLDHAVQPLDLIGVLLLLGEQQRRVHLRRRVADRLDSIADAGQRIILPLLDTAALAVRRHEFGRGRLRLRQQALQGEQQAA